MIDLQQLIYLKLVAECGTISKAAEILHVSQPAISRAIQRLEEDLQVKIFTRRRNRVELNENGKLALKFAEKILNDSKEMIDQIRALDRSRRTISIGSIAPMPMLELIPILNQLYSGRMIATELTDEENLERGILDSTYQLAISPRKIDNPRIFSNSWDFERLYFLIPKDHKFAKKSSLKFSDLDGESILIFSPIGFWKFVRDVMPRSKFIEQDDREKFSELISESNLLAFKTDKTIDREGISSNRVAIPIEDSSASVEYFLCCRIELKKFFEKLFKSR